MTSPSNIVSLVTGTACGKLQISEHTRIQRLPRPVVRTILHESVLDIEARTNTFISRIISTPAEVDVNLGHVIESDDALVSDLIYEVWESGFRHITNTYVPRDDGAVFRGDVIVVDGREKIVSESDGRIVHRVIGWSGHPTEVDISVADPSVSAFRR